MLTKTMQIKRLDDIDILKGIGIIIMIMGHVGFSGIFDVFIHSFHMPLFFVVSGYLFKKRDQFNISEFAFRKAKQLLVPYVCYGLFFYISWLIFFRDESNVFQPLINLFTYNTEGLPIAGALWFLTALFFMEIFYSLIVYNIKSEKLVTIIVLLISTVVSVITTLTEYRLPLTIDIALACMIYYHFGTLLRKAEAGEKIMALAKKMNSFYIIISILGLLFINACITFFVNGYVNFKSGWHGIVPLSWLNALIGIFALYLAALFIDEKIPVLKKFLSFVGKTSIIYLCLNQFVIEIFVLIIGNPIGNMGKFTLSGAFISIVILILTVAVLSLISLINTHIKRAKRG
ncbi:MAG: acyltransferase family protein [Clostridia bacterium]